MIYVDSLEKKWLHIEAWFKKHGVEYVFPHRLVTGDYINPASPEVIIDRKHGLNELYSNLSRGKNNISRFSRECQRAWKAKQRFIVLIEGTTCKCIKDVECSGKSKYSPHDGRWLANEMWRLTMAYNVEWIFCDTRVTAKTICELLGVQYGS